MNWRAQDATGLLPAGGPVDTMGPPVIFNTGSEAKMTWFHYSIISAFFTANSVAISKKALEGSDVYTVAWVRYGYALPFLLCMLAFTEIPPLDSVFFLVNLIQVPLNGLAIVLYIRAIKYSPLSLTLPYLALTPVFLIGTSYVMLGERPDSSGLIGILFVALGAYLLNVRATREGLLGPLRAILDEEGSLLMIGVAFIYSITGNLSKIAILHSSPTFFAAFYPAVMALALFPLLMLGDGSAMKKVFSRPILFASIGLLTILTLFTG
ncbi:MAG: DMT family transporter, partial [Candidatus Brocadiales bacterium]